MSTPRSALLLTLGLALLAGVPAPAMATDRSIERAWDADDPAFRELGLDARRANARWVRSGYRRAAPLLRVTRRTQKALRANTRAVRAQEPSTATGARAKRFALLSNGSFARQLRFEVRGIRLFTRGRRVAGRRAFARAQKASNAASRASKSARRLFRRAAAEAA